MLKHGYILAYFGVTIMKYQNFDIHFYIHFEGRSSIFFVRIAYENRIFREKKIFGKMPSF